MSTYQDLYVHYSYSESSILVAVLEGQGQRDNMRGYQVSPKAEATRREIMVDARHADHRLQKSLTFGIVSSSLQVTPSFVPL